MVDVIGDETVLMSLAQTIVAPFTGKKKSIVTTLKKELYETYYNGLISPEAKI